MGTWGTGLYSDDTACDVRNDYIEQLKSGRSSEEATEAILARFADLIGDRQLECLVILPLADTQWQYGRLQPPIRDRALTLIRNGADLAHWAADAPSAVPARKQALKRLEARLHSTPPAPKPLELRVPRERPKKIRMTAGIGTVFLLPVSESLNLPLVLLAYRELEKSVEPIFCVFPMPVLPGTPLPADAFDSAPLALDSGAGPASVFGAFPKDERSNPWKSLAVLGMATDIRLPAVPDAPVFYSFGGMISRILSAFQARSAS
ncbi:hypothetical protein ACFONG_13840 [Uliginosibacterium paludis]|uniref:DUF4259 domain-containing protein n=1 Tax=Uliginosibacterium paludis TaxID=1615952 RepID=A0ABV2CPI4_9RHOO